MSKRDPFRCDHCERQEAINTANGISPEERARVAGWRIGTNGKGERQRFCPECSGVDADYWDERTLGMAYAAGIDAGNTAWGQEP